MFEHPTNWMTAIAVCVGITYWLYEAIRRDIERQKLFDQAILEFRWHPDMTPRQFESRCAEYLNLKGWKAFTTPATGDQGADVVAKKSGKSVVIQCKKYRSKVGNKAVQEVYAARHFYSAQLAVVVSNQQYTKSAKALAERKGVLLLHFTDLAKLDGYIPARSGV
jgi:restriction system protein